MSKRPPQRTLCDACAQPCRVQPTEFMISTNDGRYRQAEWRSKLLCPPCQRAELDFWFRRGARPVRPAWSPLRRPAPEDNELQELSDRELLDQLVG